MKRFFFHKIHKKMDTIKIITIDEPKFQLSRDKCCYFSVNDQINISIPSFIVWSLLCCFVSIFTTTSILHKTLWSFLMLFFFSLSIFSWYEDLSAYLTRTEHLSKLRKWCIYFLIMSIIASGVTSLLIFNWSVAEDDLFLMGLDAILAFCTTIIIGGHFLHILVLYVKI